MFVKRNNKKQAPVLCIGNMGTGVGSLVKTHQEEEERGLENCTLDTLSSVLLTNLKPLKLALFVFTSQKTFKHQR